MFDATVYFNSNDVLMTVDRNGIKTEFDFSVYRNKLDRCLVYLDDAHTRGTDLKFPLGWKACVTLSGDITRDKTVQACMRVRNRQSTIKHPPKNSSSYHPVTDAIAGSRSFDCLYGLV